MDMEVSDFSDWIEAAEALKIDDVIFQINCIASASNPKSKYAKNLKARQLMIFGENPYKPDQRLIDQTKKIDLRLKKRGKRDSSQAQT